MLIGAKHLFSYIKSNYAEVFANTLLVALRFSHKCGLYIRVMVVGFRQVRLSDKVDLDPHLKLCT